MMQSKARPELRMATIGAAGWSAEWFRMPLMPLSRNPAWRAAEAACWAAGSVAVKMWRICERGCKQVLSNHATQMRAVLGRGR